MLSTGDFLEHATNQPEALDGLRCSAIALATVIGGVTATGSFVAFGKLNGNMSSAALALAQRDQINIGMGIGTLGCMALFVAKPTLATGTLCMPLIGSDWLWLALVDTDCKGQTVRARRELYHPNGKSSEGL